jgi:hypothetical protein
MEEKSAQRALLLTRRLPVDPPIIAMRIVHHRLGENTWRSIGSATIGKKHQV